LAFPGGGKGGGKGSLTERTEKNIRAKKETPISVHGGVSKVLTVMKRGKKKRIMSKRGENRGKGELPGGGGGRNSWI